MALRVLLTGWFLPPPRKICTSLWHKSRMIWSDPLVTSHEDWHPITHSCKVGSPTERGQVSKIFRQTNRGLKDSYRCTYPSLSLGRFEPKEEEDPLFSAPPRKEAASHFRCSGKRWHCCVWEPQASGVSYLSLFVLSQCCGLDCGHQTVCPPRTSNVTLFGISLAEVVR